METKKISKGVAGFGRVNNKNIVIFILSLVIVVIGFIAFQQNREKTKLISDYQSERSATESYLNQTFETIESNLTEIRMREGIIESNLENPETTGNLSPEEKIQNEIQIIESIMEKNRALIADLNLKVDSQNADLIKYKKTISQTNKRLEEFKQEVANLMAINEGLQTDLATAKNNYSNLESDYQTKIDEINSKSQIINEQLSELQKRELEMNTVFYTVGDFKELNEENLVEKEGGVLGIGSTKVLANTLDQKKFVKVDRRDLKVIPINGKKVDLVTKHDITSYEIVMKNGRADKLVINNPEAFWRDSKYLVILVKDQEEDLAELNK